MHEGGFFFKKKKRERERESVREREKESERTKKKEKKQAHFKFSGVDKQADPPLSAKSRLSNYLRPTEGQSITAE